MPGGVLVPEDEETRGWLESVKLGGVVKAELTRPRNYKFHKKFMALLRVGYEHWEPGEINSRFGVPEKNFKRYMDDVIILAGHYHLSTRLNGDVVVEADSISFGNMNEETFSELYNKVINVLLKHVTKNYTKEDLENTVSQILEFT